MAESNGRTSYLERAVNFSRSSHQVQAWLEQVQDVSQVHITNR